MELASPSAAPSPAQVLKVLTGIEPIDRVWGGFYRGGSYLVYGRAASGRDLLPLRFMQMGAQAGESGLLISPARPKDLMIQSASIGFNLRYAYEQGIVRLMRIPPVLSRQADDDSDIVKALRDLVAIIRQYRPQRLVIHDFMPFMAFRSYDQLRAAFVEMLEQTDVLDMTMVLVMPQPANAQSSHVIEFMKSQMTGTLHVDMDAGRPESTERRLVLMPNIGHLQRQTTEPWDLRDVVLDEPAPNAPGARHLQQPARAQQAAPKHEGGDSMPGAREEATLHVPPPAYVRPGAPAPPKPVPLGSARQAAQPEQRLRLGGTPPEAPGAAPRTDAPPVPLERQAPVEPAPGRSPAMPRAGSYITSNAPSGRQEAAVAAPRFSAIEATGREAFAARLQQHFQQRDAGAAAFLLVALRVEPHARQSPFDFETLSDHVVETLRPQDDAFVDAEREHMVVLLGNTRPEEQHAFFARLKSHLREQMPQQADALIHAVSAFVVPNGQPFGTAEEFLSYVLEEA